MITEVTSSDNSNSKLLKVSICVNHTEACVIKILNIALSDFDENYGTSAFGREMTGSSEKQISRNLKDISKL